MFQPPSPLVRILAASLATSLAGASLGVASAAHASPPPRAPIAAKAIPSPDAVLAVLNRANAAQIAAMRAEPIPVTTGGAVREMSSNWVSATYYVGAARLARVTNDVDTLKFLTDAAEHYNYALRGAKSGKPC
jgi:hypothetical protein